jgi:hypothetical protein
MTSRFPPQQGWWSWIIINYTTNTQTDNRADTPHIDGWIDGRTDGWMCKYIYTYIHYIYMYTLYVIICIYIYIYILCIYVYMYVNICIILFVCVYIYIYIFLCWFDMLCLCNKTLTWTCDFSIQLMETDTPSKLGWVKWLVVLDMFWWSIRSWFHNIDPAAGLKPPVKRICDDLFLRNTRFGGFMILKVLLGGSSHLSG